MIQLYDRPGLEDPSEIERACAWVEPILPLQSIPERDSCDGPSEIGSSRVAFQELLSDLAHQFATASSEPTDSTIADAQVRICRALKLDCCAWLRVTDHGTELEQVHTWTNPECGAESAFCPKDQFPWLAREVLAGRAAQVPDCGPVSDDLPLRAHSAIFLPLVAGEVVVGALAFGSITREVQWTGSLEIPLRTAVDLLSNLLARDRAERQARQLRDDLRRLREQFQCDTVQVRENVKIDQRYESIIGKSQAIGRVIAQAEQVAGTESIVLVTGETGTGKELIAQLIHDLSPRRGKRMVKVNCAALPPSLVESELFGRERGAYTGALTREIGRFELAHNSTIFLDELAELPIELQGKLLRVLQGGEFERVGNPKPICVNVRVIAATNRELKRAVAEHRFREDLYYRLNVFPIEVPPLRERPEDIPMLAWAFASEFGNVMGKTIEAIPQASMDALQRYPWPGNVRELRNVIERAMIVTGGPTLRVSIPQSPAAPEKGGTLNLRDVERQHILEVMRQTRWRVRGAGGAAELLGLKPTTLEARMARLGISRSSADCGN